MEAASTVQQQRTSLTWPLLATYVGFALYVLSPNRDRYPAVMACLVAFALFAALFPRVRPVRDLWICPLNWTLLVFFLQLVVVPLVLCYSGPYPFTLPYLPSDGGINIALLISCLAFGGFCIGYHLSAGRAARRSRMGRWSSPSRPWIVRPAPVLACFVTLGLIGVLLAFNDLGTVLNYFAKPAGKVGEQFNAGGNSAQKTASLVLRTFLGFAVVVAWCDWIARNRNRPRRQIVAGTLLAAIGIVLTYGTFAYNRGAFVAPLVALAAVYGSRVRKLTVRWAVVIGAVGFLVLAGFRVYRTSALTPGKLLTDASARQTLIKKTNVDNEVQVYAGGPQFLAYLLQGTNYAQHLHYGETLLSSAMYPVPKLGAPFRSSSGVDIYNRLIYGNTGVVDQIVPFQGELFLDFSFPGVLIGYMLLGLLIQRLQRGFLQAPTPLQAFAWQYAATWTAFLVIGSLAVVSQIFVYFFWPIIALAVWSRLRPDRQGRSRLRPTSAPGPTGRANSAERSLA